MLHFMLVRRLPWQVFARFSPSVRFAQTVNVTSERHPELPLPTFLPVGHPRDVTRIIFFEAHVGSARTPRDRSTYEKAKARGERMNSEGNLRCPRCELVKTVDSFYGHSGRKYGRQSYCKVCDDNVRQYYSGFTLRGVMVSIILSSKNTSLRRSEKPLREEAGQFELDLDFLLNLWLRQKGRCTYSGIVMNVERGTHWRLSLERLDNTRGYIPGNVAFVCAEFNTADSSINAKHSVLGSSKWSKDKVLSLPDIADSSVPLRSADLDTLRSTGRLVEKRKNYTRQEVTSNGDLLCTLCGQFKPMGDFNIHPKTSSGRKCFCKFCESVKARENITSFGGFLRMRVGTAKANAVRRAEKGRGDAGMFNLTIDDVVNMYRQQRGLCYYARVKMILEPCTDWMLAWYLVFFLTFLHFPSFVSPQT
eukprot:GEMP01051658.1.p1 GENE.GEMP01051658.1~~GEMP01051658.1.p1  ORF type:complete len:420 (+),score=11.04 GEMP01051658.1:143-1402(+)